MSRFEFSCFRLSCAKSTDFSAMCADKVLSFVGWNLIFVVLNVLNHMRAAQTPSCVGEIRVNSCISDFWWLNPTHSVGSVQISDA